eukprot:Partr_v1_DN28877_c2_g2_i3_m33097
MYSLIFLFLVALVVFQLAGAVPSETQSVKFENFKGPLLSDPAERQLLYSMVKHAWPLEDYWNEEYVESLCTYSANEREPEVLSWFLKKGLTACHQRAIVQHPDVYATFNLIFRAILSFEDDKVDDLFPLATRVMKRCGVSSGKIKFNSKLDRLFKALLKFDSSWFNRSMPVFNRRAGSAEEIEQAFKTFLEVPERSRRLLTVGRLNQKAKNAFENFLNVCGDRLSQKREIRQRFKKMVAPLRHDMLAGGRTVPSEDDSQYSSLARRFLDEMDINDRQHLSSLKFQKLLFSGILKCFMRDDSGLQLLESGLAGPIWEEVRQVLDRNCVTKHKLWFAKNLPKLAGMKSAVAVLCTKSDDVSKDLLDIMTLFQRNVKINLTNGDKQLYMSSLFRFPKLGRFVFDNLLHIEHLHLSSNERASLSFDRFTREFIAIENAKIPSVDRVKEALEEKVQIIGQTIARNCNLNNADVQFVHGRTAYLTEQGKAIKIEKKGKSELDDEMRMDLFFQKHQAELQLTSDLPRNPILLKRVKLDQGLADKLAPENAEYELHEAGGFYTGLEFDVPEGYNIPLHGVESMQELESASAKSLGDAAILAKSFGLVSIAPADLFHNLEANRRYIWNIDMKPSILGKNGAGRLDQWRKAIRHVNMGQSGIRDLKHYMFVDEIKTKDTPFDRVFSFLTNIGNFLLCWMLSVGEWFMTHGFDQTELQSVLTDGLSTFMSKFTDKPIEECTEFVSGALRLDRLARQMKYFMAKEYVNDLAHQIKTPIQGLKKFFTTKKYILGPYIKSKIPGDIYGEDMKSISGHKPSQFWNEKEGWMRHEGEEDLGPYNGPFPIT